MDKFSKQQNHRAFGIEFLGRRRGMYRGKPGVFAVVLGCFLLLSTCGMEDYPYLEPIREDAITRELNVRATIPLPFVSSQEFTHFVIYYRIYISDESILSEILPTDMSRINTTLYGDYSAFYPYTNTDNTTVSTQIGTLFANRKYYSLYSASVDMNSLLSSSSMSQRIVIDFAQINGRKPTIELGGAEYILWRTTGRERSGEANFDIEPDDRSFINTQDLNSDTNARSDIINNDVVNKTISGPRYTYVSMYIVATGYDNNYNPIYSQPARIGTFRLPDP
jgi:hypothetical protein